MRRGRHDELKQQLLNCFYPLCISAASLAALFMRPVQAYLDLWFVFEVDLKIYGNCMELSRVPVGLRRPCGRAPGLGLGLGVLGRASGGGASED